MAEIKSACKCKCSKYKRAFTPRDIHGDIEHGAVGMAGIGHGIRVSSRAPGDLSAILKLSLESSQNARVLLVAVYSSIAAMI
jgi:hypothetical protein